MTVCIAVTSADGKRIKILASDGVTDEVDANCTGTFFAHDAQAITISGEGFAAVTASEERRAEVSLSDGEEAIIEPNRTAYFVVRPGLTVSVSEEAVAATEVAPQSDEQEE